MLQNPCKTLGFKKNIVCKIPPGGGKPYPASGLICLVSTHGVARYRQACKDHVLRLWTYE